jgi:glutathione S-transferase
MAATKFNVQHKARVQNNHMAPILPLSSWLWLGITSLVIPTWEKLESKLPSQEPLVFEEQPPSDLSSQVNMPVLYRDKAGLCPFAQRVWLGLEVKKAEYITVLVDSDITTATADTTRSANSNGWSSPLKIQWPDGSIQTDTKEILERLNQEYPNEVNFYPDISKAVDSVRCNIVRFDGVFPRNTQPNLYAPYLIRQLGDKPLQWVPESDHMVSLEETDEVMEEYFTGPFLCGNQITAADIVWAPFLDRYAAQLPMIYEGDPLTPRSSEYETLKEWYEAMESQIPCYACRVMGDKQSWQRVLQYGVEQQLVPNVDLLPPRGSADPLKRRKFNGDKVWEEYKRGKPYVCETSQLECIAFYVRNRERIISEATRSLANMNHDEIEQALLEVLGVVLENEDKDAISKMSGNARELATYLNEKLRVPRDMGALPASAMRTLTATAPKPRISSR